MSSSDLSELTSNVSTDDEVGQAPVNKGKLDRYFTHGSNVAHTPPPLKKKRPPSPPHEYVLADNPDIAFICMFRSRFSDAFQKSLPHYGPQDIEIGVAEPIPGEHVERLLCAILGLVLNRKKDIEKGHYTRALEEAIHAHANQWPAAWQGRNPLHGGGSFNNMTPEQRLTLIKTLIIWSLESSEAVKAIIKESYKQSRHDDDLNQPLSVQPWGRDGDKRRFWLIEGQDDTHFRLYRESNPSLKHNTWRSVAGTIDEVKEVAHKLEEERTQASRRLRDRILAAIPRFEASEEKRKRRDYRLARKAQFTRPEPGFSLYEGRTRGKRIRYIYSDEEDGGSDGISTRRSHRRSGISTPAEPAGPTYTASGRQVRSRHGGAYGESMLSGQHEPAEVNGVSGMDAADDEDDEPVRSRYRRAAQTDGLKNRIRARKAVDDTGLSDDMDDATDITSSGHEWEGADYNEPDDEFDEEEEEDEDIELSDEVASRGDIEHSGTQRSLVVSLRYAKVGSSPAPPDGKAEKKRVESAAAIPKDTEMFDVPVSTASQLGPDNGKHSSQIQYQQSMPTQAAVHAQISLPSSRQQPLNPLQHRPPKPSLLATESQQTTNPHTYVFKGQASAAPLDKPSPSSHSTPERAPPPVSLP